MNRFALRRRIENAERETVRESADELRRSENRRRLLRHRVAVGPGQFWRATDATTVVQTFARAVDVVAVHVEPEQAATRDKEWPALIEKRFVRREVQHGRIRFDLTEVRIDRRVDRQIRSEAILDVTAERHVRPVGELVVRDL